MYYLQKIKQQWSEWMDKVDMPLEKPKLNTEYQRGLFWTRAIVGYIIILAILLTTWYIFDGKEVWTAYIVFFGWTAIFYYYLTETLKNNEK